MINYKYNEGELLKEVTEYINKTYGEHYSKNKFQATEFIIDSGHGIGFTVGNILKYAQRYGQKGTPEDHRKDLMKVIHYAIMALYIHDEQHQKQDVLELDAEMFLDKFDISKIEGQPVSIGVQEDPTIAGAAEFLSRMVKTEGTIFPKEESPVSSLLAKKPPKKKTPQVDGLKEVLDEANQADFSYNTNDKE